LRSRLREEGLRGDGRRHSQGTSYLRLEADRASGDAKLELDSSALELDKLADAAGKGVQRMRTR